MLPEAQTPAGSMRPLARVEQVEQRMVNELSAGPDRQVRVR